MFQNGWILAEPKQTETNFSVVGYWAKFTISSAPKSALLRFFARGKTTVALDGATIHHGPGSCSGDLLYYDERPIAPEKLSCGEHLFALRELCEDATAPGIAFELELDGKVVPLAFTAAYFTMFDENAPENSGTGHAESVNWQSSQRFWRTTVFPEAVAVRTDPNFPLEKMHKRIIPLFEETREAPVSLETEADGTNILATFPAMTSGRVEIQGIAKSATVVLEYLEDLRYGWISPEGMQSMYADRFTVAAGQAFQLETAHIRPCRYLRIIGAQLEGLHVRLAQYRYPLEEKGFFECSDAQLNTLCKIADATLKVCMEDVYFDCPHRDRQQWMDAFISAQAALALHGTLSLTRKCLSQYGGTLVHNRIFSPSIKCDCWLPDYAMVFTEFLRWYYEVTKDRTLILELLPNLRIMLADAEKLEDAGHLLTNPPPPDFLYLDNTFELAKEKSSCGLNALYILAWRNLAFFEELTGDAEASAAAKTKETLLTEEFLHRYLRSDGTMADTEKKPDERWAWLVNFSCEKKVWFAPRAELSLSLQAPEEGIYDFEYAAYAGVKILVNGSTAHTETRTPNWCRQPMYDFTTLPLALRAGENTLVFEVEGNRLNWELFLRTDPRCPIRSAHVDGKAIRLRKWRAPSISQSTQSYAAYAALPPSTEKRRQMLLATVREKYIRTYKSIRVPSFCSEAATPEEEIAPWVMPCNT
ncbi:MAG: hypothetical protein PHS41_10935, partial [Victivallaceae bacterium]|nr:hypothetical protein [Victivallaceae bacterium]